MVDELQKRAGHDLLPMVVGRQEADQAACEAADGPESRHSCPFGNVCLHAVDLESCSFGGSDTL